MQEAIQADAALEEDQFVQCVCAAMVGDRFPPKIAPLSSCRLRRADDGIHDEVLAVQPIPDIKENQRKPANGTFRYADPLGDRADGTAAENSRLEEETCSARGL